MQSEFNTRCEPLRRMLPSAFLGGAAVALSILAAVHGASAASNLSTLYSFCAEVNCTDGSGSAAALVSDADGNLYGTTAGGGDQQWGTAFELVRDGANYGFHRLYSFCAKANCADGAGPRGKLVVDANGNLYGTTYRGGKFLQGTAFELIHNARRTKWKIAILHQFCKGNKSGCPDGQSQTAGLTYQGAQTGAPYDGVSPLYGVSSQGGANHRGAVFELLPVEGSTTWKQKVLYDFCPEAGCANGDSPGGGLVTDASGNLYGATVLGGSVGVGTVFQLSPQKHGFAETVLYSFCQVGALCSDGQFPKGDLTMDAQGLLYGTTQQGGSDDNGTVFRIKPNGTNSTESTLYTFCSSGDCSDGLFPSTGVVIGPNGDFFGTTNGGAGYDGTLFKLHGAHLSVLHSFCSEAGCADGQGPSGLILDSAGNLFGPTFSGGSNGNGGTVFELTP